ncbi:MAG: transcription antitermination factor NusB [Candidatus Firestonebacteria bacterium RIFOXYC2_FULL_39_67]|nr:MAG: transcription antitermination factor NusB [Candidatus Firestonebacteria bacterium RIFOXYD2_FULL_39_29]OGF53374.1 MAG: transcription antitermination factor NusB [Candidatus Firestonebacteria bacterium RIFOXYC2_FULL_39_67]OGF57915.1 MAG: transcription antitermination factor NusB [Candidatus Firestonebacteria bacterium RifOxyC12_full_39_7]
MGERRKSRVIALQMLFSADLGKLEYIDLKKDFLEELDEEPKVKAFAFELVKGTIENLKEIDDAIKNRIKNWDFDRLANVDKNILRFAAYELLFRDDIPVPVTINEAIEIAKSFSGPEAGKFINGILDNIKKDIKIKKEEYRNGA